ncbi:MAG: sugar ABC transporter permease, partial [Spirochaetia bacterium]|nr:sugar ABC transporter permease [Spirochaetia bacterium]
MSNDIFGRAGNDLSENAIKGMVEDELKVHKKEDVGLPIIKLKLSTAAESVLEIKKQPPPQKKKEKPEGTIFDVLGAAKLAQAKLESVVKLPDTLNNSQKLRKAFRYRRFGMAIREVPARPVTALPELRKQDKHKLAMYKLRKPFLGAELLIPAFIIFLLFSWLPMLKAFIISFQKFETMNSTVYVGLANFSAILSDPKFWQSLLHSGILSGIVILFGTWIPLFLALYMYEMRRGSSLMKILYFIPFLTPAVPAAILWKWMYNQGFGLINGILSLIAGSTVSIGWLTDPRLVLFSIALVFIWKNTGWAILIYMAGLQNIPKNLFEDAALNGAGVWTKIRQIIIPELVPVIMAVVFIQILNGMQVFTEVYIMTNGGPEGASEVLATYM